MMNILVNMTTFLKNIFILSMFVTSLITFGLVTNAFIPWSYLTILFTLVRNFISPIDFMWDTDTTLVLVGFSFLFEGAVWGIRAFLGLVKMPGFNKS